METNRVRQFCTICETKSLRAAADLLGLTHSALSKSMKVLQEEVNEKLLTQEGRGILITDAGREFYRKAKLFLEQEAEFLSRKSQSKSVRIGTFEIFSTYLLPNVWREYFPELDLELQELLPGKIEEEVESGRVDIGITRNPIPRQGVEFLKVAECRNGVFVRKGAFSGTPIGEVPFVVPITPLDGTPTDAKGLDGWPSDKIDRFIRHRVSMLESGLSFVRTGEVAIYLPVFLARIHNEGRVQRYQLEELPVPKSLRSNSQPVYIVKRRSTPEDVRIKKVAKLLRVHCQD